MFWPRVFETVAITRPTTPLFAKVLLKTFRKVKEESSVVVTDWTRIRRFDLGGFLAFGLALGCIVVYSYELELELV